MDEIKYLIDGVEYLKAVVEESPELKKALLSQLKKQHYRDRARIHAKEYRATHKATINEYNKAYRLRKMKDEDYKIKADNYQRQYKLSHPKDGDILVKLKGRPSMFKLNIDLGLMVAIE